MRILLTTEVFLPRISGLVTSVRNLAEGLVEAGDEVVLACPDSRAARAWARDAGVSLLPVRCVALGAGLALPLPGPALPRRVGRVDVVHVHSPGVVGSIAARAARRSNVPVLGSLHTLPGNVVGPLGISLDRLPRVTAVLTALLCRPLAHVDIAIAPSEFGRRILWGRLPRIDARVVSNGVALEIGSAARRARSLPSDGRLRALYVGRLQREKRVDELVAGVAAARAGGADVELTIVGAGPEGRRLRRSIDDLGMTAYVELRGRLSACALAREYERATIFCIASRAELQCCAALEAMAAGLPVLAARHGALPETTPDGIVGRLYAPGDVQELGRALRELGDDPDAYREHSSAALSQARAHALVATVRKVRALYDEVLRPGGAVRAGGLPE